jgi:hypothetical protein
LNLQQAAIAAFHVMLPRVRTRGEPSIKEQGPHHCHAIMSQAAQISNR